MKAVSIFPFLGATVLAAPLCGNATGTSDTRLNLLPSTVTHLQLALFLENLEAEFFRSAVSNLTDQDARHGASFRQTVQAAAMQEVAHQQALANILGAAGAAAVPPCRYVFPSTNTDEFLSVGKTLSVIGAGATVGLVGPLSATNPELVQGIASIAATEARHAALFDVANDAAPNPTAFETPIPGTWAFNLALGLAVPGTCPLLPPHGHLAQTRCIPPGGGPDAPTRFTWDAAQEPFKAQSAEPLYVAWVNQMRPPIYTPLGISAPGSGDAKAPEGLQGAVVVVLTAQNRLERLEELAAATLAGPVVLVV
ncbi:hypothetical protein PG999_005582 [Apiospora kogelbergensis]|uniref:Ferritin-like domain-containing protein n=1 Tax=Apiospora kogelbergensis TaxID=1337665 RepID=A0AAW0R2G5_9PEZI